ncbi:MAG: proteasome assembly chaperone family protein [Thermoplasmatota archaeon]
MDEKCVEINEEEEIPEVDCLVAGFPGTGLIGGMAAEQLINSLDLKQVASLNCDEFPPTAVIFEGVPRRPVRFFAGDGFILVKSDMVIPPDISHVLAETIIDWAIDKGVKEVIIFDGIQEREEAEEENKIWGVLSSHEAEDEAQEIGIDIIKRGAISGISSSLLLSANERDLEAVGMLAEGTPKIPDPAASAKLLDKFAAYKGIELDTEPLRESAEELEEQYSKLVQQTKQAEKEFEHRSASPPLYG